MMIAAASGGQSIVGCEWMMKRALDLSLSLLGLFVLSPLLAAIAMVITFDSRGPVFYRGLRAGRFGVPFQIFKFRTMAVDAEKLGGASTPEDDPRVTRAGKVLRKYKLDELPQLLNVITGEMSVVGPRPQVLWAVVRYSHEEMEILNVRPGITDMASIRFRNEAEILRHSTDADLEYFAKIHPEKMRLGLEYVKMQSSWLDCKIICKTLAVIFSSKGTDRYQSAVERRTISDSTHET
jgi:lipopolysaccharide/colanic/teichoic acid biosynthesis glycosyltransferase